jgi:hypothetical protein
MGERRIVLTNIHRSDITRPEAAGIASGVFFMALFGALWGLVSAGYLSGGVQILAFVLVGVVTLGLAAAGAGILRQAKSLPDSLSAQEAEQGGRISTYFGVVFGVEFALIAVVAIWLSRIHAYPMIPAAVALIVGIHFFPLARLFGVPGYWITGALLCALALAAIAGLSLSLPLDGASPYHWSLFVGIGATLVLWLTAGYVAGTGLRLWQRDE